MMELTKFDLNQMWFKKLINYIAKIEQEDEITTKKQIEIVTMLNKLSADDAKILVNLVDAKIMQLAVLISKMDFNNATCWISVFKGKIYGFSKYWKKNFVMKFPNYAVSYGI